MWTAILSGNVPDLESLAIHAQSFPTLGFTVTKAGNAYFLMSPAFDGLPDADAVRSCATKLLIKWNGVARLTSNHSPVGIHQIFQQYHNVDDRGRQTVTCSLSIPVAPAGWKGQVSALLGTIDPGVIKMLEIAGIGPLDWVNAYRIYEVIRMECGGDDGIVSRGWASRREIKRFTGTANHPEAAGPGARHGVLKEAPLPNPMSATEASELITRLLTSFLDLRLGYFPKSQPRTDIITVRSGPPANPLPQQSP